MLLACCCVFTAAPVAVKADNVSISTMGVKIGCRCVIGAGSVVTHDIPDDSVAAGNPARVIRTATDE